MPGIDRLTTLKLLREGQKALSPEERARGERLATLAVAMAEQFEFSDEALLALRVASALGRETDDPLLTDITACARSYEAQVYGEGREREAVLDELKRVIAGPIFEALVAIEALVQPVTE